MIAKVAIVVTFLKVVAAKFNLVVTGVFALIVAILSSIGVWYYYIATTETAITMAMIMLLVEVAIGATIGYKLLPSSVKDFDLKNLRGEVLNRGSSL
jgi:hypothetical protein